MTRRAIWTVVNTNGPNVLVASPPTEPTYWRILMETGDPNFEGRATRNAVAAAWVSVLSPDCGYARAETIIPAPIVSFVDSSIRMKAPVARFSA